MASPKPKVRVVGTGGSIAGIGANRLDYTRYSERPERLAIADSLARIPEVHEVADVEGENVISTGSTAIGPKEWLQISQRINQILREEPDVAGVAVTHGTATLEETAYFLHLTVKSSKPVVVTGAMRPPSALSTDSDINLLDAVRVAACPAAAGIGVLTVLNNEIHSARDVIKANNYRVETFRPNELGFLGYCDSDGQVVFYRTPTRKHTLESPFDVDGIRELPRVDVVYAYAGADSLLVDAVRERKSDGLVLGGFGGGTYPPPMLEAAMRAVEEGILVVMASRATAGRVIMTPRKHEQGFLVSDNLLPQKARILLMLALTVTRDRGEIQQMFAEY